MQPVLVVLACFCGLLAAIAVTCTAYCVVQVQPVRVAQREARIAALEAAFPAWEQRGETLRDAAGADLEEAQRQRQRASNTRAGAGKRDVATAPTTRAEVLALVKQRYGE